MKQLLTIEWPDDLQLALDAAGYSADRLSREAVQQLATKLFRQQVLSLGQAARLAGMSRWDFIPLLGSQGIPVADYSAEEIEQEMEAVRWVSQRTNA